MSLHKPANAEANGVVQPNFGDSGLEIDLVREHVERFDNAADPPIVLGNRHDDERVLGVVDADLIAVVVETDRRRRARPRRCSVRQARLAR